MLDDFISSIISFKAYGRLKNNRLWKVILYLVLISFICALFILGSIQKSFGNILLVAAENYDERVPDFIIEDGKLRLKEGAGTIIDKKGTVLIFDDSGKMDENTLRQYKQGAAFFEDRVVIRLSRRREIVSYWRDLDLDGTDKVAARDYLGMVPSFFIMLTIFFILGLILINFIFTIVIALTFYLICRILKRDFNYLQLFKMTVYTLTLPMLLLTLMVIIFGVGLQLNRYVYPYYLSPIYLSACIGGIRFARVRK
jgi:hypothetical protein